MMLALKPNIYYEVKKLFFILIMAAAAVFVYLSLASPRESQTKGFHYSVYSQAVFFDHTYENIEGGEAVGGISGIIVNHHLIAPHLIARAVGKIATQKPVTVVLISPNHFLAGSGKVISSVYEWQTPYGVLSPDERIIKKLLKEELVRVDEKPFEEEHGIFNIVAFIKKSLPNAELVPLIVKDTVSDEEIDNLSARLKEILPADSAVVASFDFSHYLPSNAADFNDEKTLAAMQNFDYSEIKKLDIDSRSGLRLILKYFELAGAQKFTILDHTNSAKITKNYDIVETTSYITGYFTSGRPIGSQTRTALYLGELAENYSELRKTKIWRLVNSHPVSRDKPGPLPVYDNLIVGMVEKPEQTEYYFFPFRSEAEEIRLLGKKESDMLLAEMTENISVPQEIKQQIINGHLIIKR